MDVYRSHRRRCLVARVVGGAWRLGSYSRHCWQGLAWLRRRRWLRPDATRASPHDPATGNPSTLFDFRTNGAAYLCPGRAEPRGVAPFLRTELYFGTNKEDGTAVTEQHFLDFVDSDNSPPVSRMDSPWSRAWASSGGSRGIERERSMLLILLYPADTARTSGQKIEEIRKAYIDKHQQESVLRADEPLPECVSF